MKTKLLTMALFVLQTLSATAQTADTHKVFIYSPGQTSGLHLALLQAEGWTRGSSARRTTARGAPRNGCTTRRSAAPRTARGGWCSR